MYLIHANFLTSGYFITSNINETAYYIRDISHEVAYIYSEEMILLYSGDGISDTIVVPTIFLKNSTILHNHPYERCIFSEQDMKSAIENDVYSMYLSSPEGLNITYTPFENYTLYTWEEIYATI